MKFHTIFLRIIACITVLLAVAYGSFLFLLPALLNSKYFEQKVKSEVLKRTGIQIEVSDFRFISYKNLNFDIMFKGLSAAYEQNKNFIEIEDTKINFNRFKIIPKNVKIGYINFDKPEFDKLPKKEKSGKSAEFKVSNFPEISVNKSDILIVDNSSDKLSIHLKSTNIKSQQDCFVLNSLGVIENNKYGKNIPVSAEGFVYIKDKAVSVKNFIVKTGAAELCLNGKLIAPKNKYDFDLKAHNLSVKILEDAFLTLMKHLNPGDKNFIENFYDFGGTANLNLNFSPKSISGYILTDGLSAKTVKFSIPIKLPNVKFVFDKDKVFAKAEGYFGNERVYTDFSARDIFDNNRVSSGNVEADLSGKFAEIYVPYAKIKNSIGVSVKYLVQYRKPVVEYEAKIPSGANIYYKSGDLGLLGNDRRIYAKTTKIGNEIFLDTYDYSIVKNAEISNILSGNGKFIKDNGKYRLDFITGHTNGDAPVSLTGSFGRYVKGGTFNGDLRYDYAKEIITGQFNLKNSRYKNFYVNNASVSADSSTMIINTTGTYENAKYSGYINMVNSFKDKITIHDINLYLAKFVLKKNNSASKIALKLPPKTKHIVWTIENGKIRLDKFLFEKVLVENIELTGNLKNNIVNAKTPDIDFASGKISANGKYDISTNSLDAYFSAKNIDSNLAADMILNLHEQVEGLANVDMHIKTKNKLEDIKTHTQFSICEGSLTKLGSREFIVNKSKNDAKQFKFKLLDIIKVGKNKPKILKSNLNGSFDINNDEIENAEIYSKHKYFSTFIEGKYNIATQRAEVQVWGKYNKNAQKGIRVLFLPLSWITKVVLRTEKTRHLHSDKLEKIPPVEATEEQMEIFSVKATGNLNETSKLKFELKRLK